MSESVILTCVKRQAIVLFFLFLTSCALTHSDGNPDALRLGIILVIDQMLPHDFDLSSFPYTGGLKRLYTEGSVYLNADLNYANTLTAPGHSTLSTGVYPSVSGITNNAFVSRNHEWSAAVEDLSSNIVEGKGHLSPRKLLATGIGDWLIEKSPGSKVISIAGKDRSAIFLGGHKPTGAFWYDAGSGRMVTSTYYRNDLPDWVHSFNAQFLDSIPAVWTPLNGSAFSHSLSANRAGHEETPYHDLRILDFALQAVRSEKLGQRKVPDLLLIGLSATDHIGHVYGTESLEMKDHLQRLDQSLGVFIAQIEKIVGKNHFVVGLSADHGALRFPDRNINFDQSILPPLLALEKSLVEKWKLKKSFIQMEGTDGGFLDYESLKENKIDAAEIEQDLRKGMLKIDGISDVYFREELTSPTGPDRPFMQRYRNSYYSPREMDFLIRFCEKCILYSGESAPPTQHGSPYEYDSHVPLLFWGNRIPAKQIQRTVHTVDFAPTVASLLKIPYPSTVNGKPLVEVLPK